MPSVCILTFSSSMKRSRHFDKRLKHWYCSRALKYCRVSKYDVI